MTRSRHVLVSWPHSLASLCHAHLERFPLHPKLGFPSILMYRNKPTANKLIYSSSAWFKGHSLLFIKKAMNFLPWRELCGELRGGGDWWVWRVRLGVGLDAMIGISICYNWLVWTGLASSTIMGSTREFFFLLVSLSPFPMLVLKW